MTKQERINELIEQVVVIAELNGAELDNFLNDCYYFNYNIDDLKGLLLKF